MRLFAAPVVRLGGAIAALIFAASVVAGVVRILPWALSPSVPATLAPALGRGLVEMSLEAAFFVAPPIAWSVIAARLVERGDARALGLLGVRPLRALASGWTAALLFAVLGASASFAWGRDAAAPGRVVAALVDAGRQACAEVSRPSAVEVPFANVAWVCFPGEKPLAVGRGLSAAGPGGAFAARDLAVADDLRSLHATDVTFVLADGRAPARLEAREASLRGLVPLGHASNVAPAARAFLLAATALALSILVGAGALARTPGGALRASAVGAAGPMTALLVFSILERAPASPLSYALVPLAALAAALGALFAAGRRRDRRA